MSLEIAGSGLSSEVMDHHGLVAASCRDLGIVEKINARIGSSDDRRKVQPGTAVMAMIINGLGFTNHRLYLTPQFFQSKAIDQLFEEDIAASDLNDHTLGKALDEIQAYGSSNLFGEVAFEIAQEQGLLDRFAHLDSSSFCLKGRYENESVEAIEVKHGFSKDHRPDLKQVMLSMSVSGPADIPFWMEPQDGNSSDKKTFTETIERVRHFQKGLTDSEDFVWVADSALYSKDRLLKSNDYYWISRVPESILEAKKLVSIGEESIVWEDIGNGYRLSEHSSFYGDIEQRWLLVSSAQAYQREKKTLNKKLEKQDEQAQKDFWHLGNQVFSCQKDAEKAAQKLAKKYTYHCIEISVSPILKHGKAGRPQSGNEPRCVGYQVESTLQRNNEQIEKTLNSKGRFIIATNEMSHSKLSSQKILEAYKDQQGVERGFRFLKDPWFLLDSFFVKKPQRIEGLMVVMTLALLVYNYTQHKLRTKMAEQKETLPNQRGKPIENPTIRWVFQMMEGIAIVRLYDPSLQKNRAMITNLDHSRIKIIRLLGKTACLIYGISQEVAGM